MARRQDRRCDAGHHDRAHDALEKANASTDYVPVLGHVKGVVHLIAGEHQKALTSFRLSSTTAALAALIIELPPELVLVSTAAGMLSMASMASASEHQKWLMQIQKKEVETLFAMRETLGHPSGHALGSFWQSIAVLFSSSQFMPVFNQGMESCHLRNMRQRRRTY